MQGLYQIFPNYINKIRVLCISHFLETNANLTEKNSKQIEIREQDLVPFVNHKFHHVYPLDRFHEIHRDRFSHEHFSSEVHLVVAVES